MNKNNKNFYNIKFNPVILAFFIGCLHLLIMWPGILSPDSQVQYAMAISGVYNDHHPPLMSFVWRYFNYIIPGSGMMFILHLSLLYIAIYYLIKSLNNFKYKFVLLFFSLIPQIFFYSNMIWKDIGFTFSFLLVAAYLNYTTVNKKLLLWHRAIILIIILLYGTAIKYQAQFCAPVLLIWIAYILANYQLYTKNFIRILGILIILFYSVLNSINYLLIPNIQENYSWQYVKIYDLAAISVAVKKDLFPNFNKNNNFSMEELYKRFNRNLLDKYSYYMVDDLIFGDPIIKTGANYLERKQLYNAWLAAIINYPLVYLKHRIINITSMLLYHPSFKYIEKIFNNNSIFYVFANIAAYIFMVNLIPAILSVVYFVLGILAVRRAIWPGVTLICFNAVGLLMLLTLFFCSMAGTPRYTYVMVCMVHASHVFAYLAARNLLSEK